MGLSFLYRKYLTKYEANKNEVCWKNLAFQVCQPYSGEPGRVFCGERGPLTPLEKNQHCPVIIVDAAKRLSLIFF